MGEGGAAVEEVEDADCHDDGDAGDGHHGSQVDAWNDKGIMLDKFLNLA